MARDVNFTKISRRDLIEKEEIIKSAIENKNVGIVDKNVDRKDIVDVYDDTFFNKVMFIFENRQDANSCFFNNFKDRLDSDFVKSINIQHDPVNTCIKTGSDGPYSEYYTREIYTNSKANSTMNNFMLVIDQEVPKNSAIRYYLVTDKNEIFPIQANNKTPISIKDNDSLPTSVKIKALIEQGAGQIKTKIKGMALLYEDDYISSQLDIFRPDFDREVIETPEDLITLFRDPKNEDRLFKVESSTDRTLLNFNKESELESIDVYSIKTNKKLSDTAMIYEDYTNSEGVTEKVLTKIRTRNSLLLGDKLDDKEQKN
ncbi:hypothetical protein [Romboutsia sp.]|uniref:hypothetical protein n=1 Tax=Romboutsia sp. TaxID=1965302 RepID=UPI003F353DD5